MQYGVGRSTGMRLSKGKSHLNFRAHFLTVTSVRLWDRLPQKSVGAPALGTFISRLYNTLQNVVYKTMLQGQLP